MKKSSYIKLITLALSCILFIGVIGVSSSADEVEASAEFVNVTLNYGSENKIVYALSISGAEAADVQLELYNNPSLEGEPQIASFSGSYYGSYPVYYSYGISAKDLADYVYARPVLLSGEVIGETVRYSVAQYCYAVLSNPENDETLISLAEDLLAYGASAQARLIKIGNIADEPLVTEYGYAYAGVSGVSFGGYGSTLVAPDERVVPTYSGSDKVVSWNVTVGGETLNYSLEEAATGIPVSDIAKFVPVFVVSEGFNDDPNVYLDSTNEVYYKNSGVATPVVTTDPANAANKVLQIGGNSSTTQE
ncbi:MAG: hypothetical protein J6V42_01015, partial [Clostridia bacterium]|nr:hypothetical protein [Clostridia bacterium]